MKYKAPEPTHQQGEETQGDTKREIPPPSLHISRPRGPEQIIGRSSPGTRHVCAWRCSRDVKAARAPRVDHLNFHIGLFLNNLYTSKCPVRT